MKRNGFTLIETLIALFILAGGILMISLAWSGSIMHMRKSALFNDVSTLLERKMVETEAYYKDRDLKEIPEDDGGDFGTDHPTYRWTLKSREMKFPDITPLIIGQAEGGEEMLINMIKQMTEYIDKTIKEVKITVFVKSKGGKEVSFSATQYFIDYSQDFAGAMGGAAGGGGAGGGSTPSSGGGGATKQ